MIQLFGRSVVPSVVPSIVPDGAAADDMAPLPVGVGTLPDDAAEGDRALDSPSRRRGLGGHWRLALTFAIAQAVLAAAYFLAEAYVLKAWPSYRAESIVSVQPSASGDLPNSGGQPGRSFDSDTYEAYIQKQMTIVSRQDVLVNALHRLAGFERAGESDQAAAQRLLRALEVVRLGSGHEFSISARANDPAMAAQIANAVTAACIESAAQDERAADAQRQQMWQEERERVQSSLAADLAEQGALAKQPGTADDTARLDRLSELEAEIKRLQGRAAMVDGQWRELALTDSANAATDQVTPAVAPSGRSKSGVLRNTGIIGVAALFFGVLAAVGFGTNRAGLKKAEEALMISAVGVEDRLAAHSGVAAESTESENLVPAESLTGEESLNNMLAALSLIEPEAATAVEANALVSVPAAPTFADADLLDSAVSLDSAQTAAPVAEAGEVDASAFIGWQAVHAAVERAESTFAKALAAHGSTQPTNACETAKDSEPAKAETKLELDRPWWAAETPGNAAPPERPLTWEPNRMWTAHRTSTDPEVQPVALDFRAELRRLMAAEEPLSRTWPGLEDGPRIDGSLVPRLEKGPERGPEKAPDTDLRGVADDRMARMNALRDLLLVMVAKNGAGRNGTTEHPDG